MNCPNCHGRGRVVGEAMFGQGKSPPITLTEIGICPVCHGLGVLHCCEGDRPSVLVVVAESVDTDVDPNSGC
jgi:DnaJ-class molecular chaperone